jgi:tRNA pseudouridine38-40 synthase
MARYFLEVAYKGTAYKGFQIQNNASTIQSEVQKALLIFMKQPIMLTGSSRTDAGVHALQNFFHFDYFQQLPSSFIYHLNAILPPDIAVKNVYLASDNAHCRYDAVSRIYEYILYRKKNPFLQGCAYYYPYTIDFNFLQEAACMVLTHTNFKGFSKRNTQVKTFTCNILQCEWKEKEEGILVFTIEANRFLRGMVRALVATMLQVARGTLTLEQFQILLESNEQAVANFSAPACGLYLKAIQYNIELQKIKQANFNQ